MSVTVSTKRNGVQSIWKNKSFTILLSGVVLLTIGNKIYEIVLPLIMYNLTHSSIYVTNMRTAELLPNFFLGVFIGVIVDRVNKKKWILTMVGVQGILLFLLGMLIRSKIDAYYFYFLLGFLLMTFNYGFFNAQVSLTKQCVPSYHIISANSKFTFTETFFSIMGPALASVILLLPDVSSGVFITGTCYFLCLFLLNKLNVQQDSREKQWDFKEDLVQGWVAFKENRTMKLVSIFVVFANCSMTVINTAVIIFAKDILETSSSLLAFTLSFSGIGGLIGSMVATKLRTIAGLGKTLGISFLLNGIAYSLLYFTTNIVTFSFTLFLTGFAVSLYTISVYTFRHELTPPHLMGRIAGITGTVFRTGMPVAMIVSGWAIDWWGTSSIFISATIWNAVLFISYWNTRLWFVS